MQIAGGIDFIAHRRDGAGDQGVLDALIVHNEQAFRGEGTIVHAESLSRRIVLDRMATGKDEQTVNRPTNRAAPIEAGVKLWRGDSEIAYSAADRNRKRNPPPAMPPPRHPLAWPLDPEGYYARLGVPPWAGRHDHRCLSP